MEKKRILRAALAVWLCFSLCAAPLRPVLAVEDDFNDDTYEGSVQDTVVRDIEGAEDTVAPDVESAEDTVAPDVEGAEAAAAQTVEGAEAIAVLADEGEENAGTVTGHVNHAICGLVECNVHEDTYGHTHPTLTDWRPWESEDSLPGFDYFTRYYYLTKDVTVSGSWDMSNYPVHLCLNGHTITFTNVTTERNYLIRFADYQNAFDVCDCQGGGEITTTVQDTSSLNGVLVGGVNTSNQKLPSDCTFNMYGGKISNVGHGVNIGSSSNNSNRFNMYGGEISGNSTDGDGAGVYIDGGTFDAYGGSFYMYGGEISGNTCGGNGAGVYNGGRVYMYEGAKISENTCTGQEGNGAGVYSIVSLYMHGGEISKNTCGGSGAGVYCLDDGYLHLYEGAVIKENTKADGQDSNVYLDECGSRLPDPRIIISSGFETTPPIGVSGTEHYADRAFARNYDKHDYDYSAYFKSEFANYDIKYEKSDKGDRVLRFIGPPSATVTAVHENYITSGCGLQVEVKNYNGVGEPTYVWHYTSTDNTTGGTPIGESSNKFTIPYKETVPPGRYYIYCEIKDESGETVITSNTFVVFVRGYVELAPGGTVTTDEGTEVTRSEDGQTVTIKNGDNTETTMTLPEDKTTGEVKVDVVTGEVIVPEGSTVTNKVEGTDNKTPEVTISKGSGTVTPDGEVIIPGDGAATVGSGDKKSTITGGSGDTKVTPKEDGTVDVSGGGKVKTGDTSPEIILPDGGNVDPSDGSITPAKDGEDGKPTVGVDPDGDGKIDTLIVLPESGEGGEESKITPTTDGKGYTVPGGTEIKGTDESGKESASVTLPSGGTVNPDGSVTPNGTVTTGKDGETTVTIPEGGEIKANKDGGLDVPNNTEVTTGEGDNQVKIVVGNGKNDETGGGAINKDGGVDIPQGGSVTVDNGTGNPGTTITGGAGGSSITPDPEKGTVDVSGGSTVKTGGGTEITIGDPSSPSGGNSGTVDKDGNVTLPEGGSAVIGGSDGGTVVTVPEEGTIKPGENGEAEVPGGSTVKPGGSGPEMKLPDGGTVDPGGVTPKKPNGSVVVGSNPGTTITPPEGGKVTPNTDGTAVTVPGGSTVQTGETNPKITVPDGSQVDPDTGNIYVPSGTVTVKPGDNGEDQKTITIPDGGGIITRYGKLKREITINTGSLPAAGKEGEPYSGRLTAPETTGSITWTVTGLPDGLSLDPNSGEITGTPAKPGTYKVTITAADGEGNEGETTITIEIGSKPGTAGQEALKPGGKVTTEDGVVVERPDDTTVTIDGNGDGKPDVTIDVPGGSDVTVDTKTGEVEVSGGSTVDPGGNGPDLKFPEDGGGGKVEPDGSVVPEPGGSVVIDGGGSGGTTVTPPGSGGDEGRKVTPNPDGTVTVPGGTTVVPGGGDSKSPAITLPGGGNVDPGGGVKLPPNGSASIGNGKDENGNDKPGTNITSGADGGTVSPNADGSVGVSGGSTVQTGGNNPAITVGGNGAKVGSDGQVNLPENGSAAISVPGSGGSITVTTPGSGTVDKNGQTTAPIIEITSGGKNEKPTVITAPKGSTVTTGKDGTTELPVGASVSKEGDNGVTTTVTVKEVEDNGSDPTVNKEGLLTFPDGGEVTVNKTGNGKDKSAIIILPAGGSISADSTGTSDVSGVVREGIGVNAKPVQNVTITLQQGTAKYMQTVSVAEGQFMLLNVKKGFYNIVAESGEKTVTQLFNSNGSEKEDYELNLPSDNVSSILDIDVNEAPVGETTSADVSKTVMGHLNVEAELIKDQEGADEVTLTMKVAAKAETKAANSEEIKKAAKDKGVSNNHRLEFLDVSVLKKIVKGGNTDSGLVTQTGTVCEIVISFDFSGKRERTIAVYRYHDGSAAALTEIDEWLEKPASSDDGKFWKDPDTQTVHIYTNKFSTYAIGYEPEDPSTPPTTDSETPTPSGNTGSGGGSSSSSSVNVAANVTGGKVTISPARPTRGQTVTITVTPDAGYRLDSLTVTGSGGKTVELTRVGDGQYTFVMPAGSVTVKPSFVKVDSEDTEVRQRFTDVSDNAWYAEYVEYVAANGLMNGYADGRFGPDDNTTRGQIITVLYRYEGEPETGLSGFSDVNSGKYYAKAVSWGADHGIVKGYSADLFGPEDNITREQLAAILFRFAGFKGRDVSGRADLGSFADNGKISEYAVPALEWAVANGLMQGKSNSLLDPNGFATRAEVAAMLMRFVEA